MTVACTVWYRLKVLGWGFCWHLQYPCLSGVSFSCRSRCATDMVEHSTLRTTGGEGRTFGSGLQYKVKAIGNKRVHNFSFFLQSNCHHISHESPRDSVSGTYWNLHIKHAYLNSTYGVGFLIQYWTVLICIPQKINCFSNNTLIWSRIKIR